MILQSARTVWLGVPRDDGVQKLPEMDQLRRTYIPIKFYRIDIRENANTHKALWCK